MKHCMELGRMLLTYLAFIGSQFVKVQRTKEPIFFNNVLKTKCFKKCNFYVKFKRVILFSNNVPFKSVLVNKKIIKLILCVFVKNNY